MTPAMQETMSPLSPTIASSASTSTATSTRADASAFTTTSTRADASMRTLNPLTGIVLAFCICIAAFTTQSFPVLFALLAIGVGMGVVGGIPRTTLKLLGGLTTISVFLFILQILFVREGTPVFAFVTDQGLIVAGLVVLRLMVATIPLAVVLKIIPSSDLSNALVKCVHLPYKYAFTISTSLKFIPVFTQDMGAIIEAQTARGIDFDTANPARKLKMILPLCLPLLMSSVRRINQAALAAETRGFYLRTRESGCKEYPFRAVDFCVLAFAVGLVVLAIL